MSSSPNSERSFNLYRATGALLREQLRDFMRSVDTLIAPFRSQKAPNSRESTPPPVPPKDLLKDAAASTHRRLSSDDSPPPYSLSWLRSTVIVPKELATDA
jgi:hypothetical protein